MWEEFLYELKAALRAAVLGPHSTRYTSSSTKVGGRVMRPNDLSDAQIIIRQIEAGKASRRDLAALLMYLRERAQGNMVKDIAHCVAHSSRDRGFAYNHIESFVAHAIEIIARGGLLGVNVLFPIAQVADQLVEDCVALGLLIDAVKVERHLQEFQVCLSDLLEDTTLALRNTNVAECSFRMLNIDERNRLVFVIAFVGLKPGVLTVADDTKMAFPVFS